MAENYLTNTQNLINHVFWFYEDLDLIPKKEHYGLSINYSDIKERKDDFLSELINTVVSWVFNKSKTQALVNQRLVNSEDFGNALNFVVQQAYNKFRPGHPQGQFGELLLFNLIQHYFEAVPVLRKQRITTSVGHERFGADAIHYRKDGKTNLFILGESKCYESKYRFNKAFEVSLKSISETFNKLDTELDLYLYDDFLEPELEKIVAQYKAGTLENIRFELFCLVIYNETELVTGDCEESIKNNIKKIIKNRCCSFDKTKFDQLDKNFLSRINYVVFPIWKLDELLDIFQRKVGSI